MKWIVKVKAKINSETLSLVWKSDAYYPYGYQSSKKESEEKKNYEVKKTSNTSITNQNYSDIGQAS